MRMPFVLKFVLGNADDAEYADLRGLIFKERIFIKLFIKQKISAFLCACLRRPRSVFGFVTVLCAIIPGLLAMGLATSCALDGELDECPYNVRLEYWYTGSGTVNVLPDYVSRMREFVYDEHGVLCLVSERSGRKAVLYGEFTLPPGKYTLVNWANLDTASHIPPFEVGKTTLDDMKLYLDNPYSQTKSTASWQKSSEKLYYGYTTFSVRDRGVSRQRVDMVHSHCKLNILVKWKGRAPANTRNFVMTLKDIPSSYQFRPGSEIKGSPHSYYDETDETVTRSGVFYYIPGKADAPTVHHRIDVKMEITGSVSGEFVTYRLTNDTHPVFCLYAGDSPVIKEIDLWKYFRTMQIDLDNNLRQEFDLVVEVDPSGGIIVSSAIVMDWNDGGNIGGFM